MPDLEISPKTVTLTAHQAQVFEATLDGKVERNVQWAVEKDDGTIDASGLYRSPRFIFRSRKAAVKATLPSGGPTATATVELTPISFWTQCLGLYWLLVFAALAALLLLGWGRLCPACTVLVSPPVVTLTANQAQMFTANAEVVWSPAEAAGGLYRAPAQITGAQRLTLTAARKGNPEETAAAEVFLTTDFGFSLQPSRSTVLAGKTVELTPVFTPAAGGAPPAAPQETDIDWLKPARGDIEKSAPAQMRGTFRAPPKGSLAKPVTVLVLAQTKGPTPHIAGADVTILPDISASDEDCTSSRTVTGLLALVAAFGALGGLIHGISSFSTYAGNRELLPSWIWWYVFKPFLGALVAVVVFLVARAGFGPGISDLSSPNCLTAGALAALVGLFAEPATIKLRDIFDSLFTPRQDPRRDAATAAGKKQAVAPKLERLDPETVKARQSPTPLLRVIGTGFAPDCKAKVGAEFRSTAYASATELHVSLLPADIEKPGVLPVIVYNQPPDGLPSSSLTLKVEA